MKNKVKLVVAMALIILAAWAVPALGAGKYQGTDDLIDKTMQKAAGVKARKPLIDLSQGNLGLFVFAVGGFAAGAVTGYNWRRIFAEKAGSAND